MVHGKAVCGNEGYFCVFEVDGGYATVVKEEVYLSGYWGQIAKYEYVADVSLLSDLFVEKCSRILTETKMEDAKGHIVKDSDESDFIVELQNDLLKESRKQKRPIGL